MAVKPVQLDEDSEQILEDLVHRTGLPPALVLKRGLEAVRAQLWDAGERTANDLYSELDLGPGGYASAPSTESRRALPALLDRISTGFRNAPALSDEAVSRAGIYADHP